MNAKEIAQALGGAKKTGGGWQARCPAHKDKNPSLSLADGATDKVLFHCQAGCEQSAVIDALKSRGLWEGTDGSRHAGRQPPKPEPWRPIVPVPDNAPRQIPQHRLGKPSGKWAYRNEAGELLFVVCRFDKPDGGKEILPLTFCEDPQGRREWRWKGFPVPRPLYGLDRLAARPDAPVLNVEGEKAADAAQERFPAYVAVTSPGGSGAASKADWRPLKDREATLWPDHDKPGAGYARDVAKLASAAGAASVGVVEVPENFPDGWDLADEAPDGWDADKLRSLLDAAVPVETGAPAGEEADAPAADPDQEAVLAELAALSPIAYDRQREDAAKQLGIRVSTIDAEVDKRRPPDGDDTANTTNTISLFTEPDPWPDAVNGATLLDALAGAFMRYAVLPDGAAAVLALWVVHAHAHDAASVSPILGLISPTKRCGKTTALSIVQALSPRALPAANITAAALFRVVEKWSLTVLIDEADTFLRDNNELRGVINSGHNRATAFVVRTVGDDHEAQPFRTWAPKAIALIGNLPDTLADRSIAVRLRRKRPDETVERLRLDRLDALTALCRQASRWVGDNLDVLREAEPAIPSELHDRAADNWRPLLAIADRAGGEWPKQARKVARLLSGDGDDEGSAAVMLLSDIFAIFEERQADRISSADLVETLAAMEARPWPEWYRGKPISVRQVAKLLKPFGVSPHGIRTGTKTPRGYNLDDFSDAFPRYLPSPSATPQQTNEINVLPQIPSATSTPNVADRKPDKPLKNNECCGVADETPHRGGKGDKGHEKWGAEL